MCFQHCTVQTTYHYNVLNMMCQKRGINLIQKSKIWKRQTSLLGIKGSILGEQGAEFNIDIPLETQWNWSFTCVKYIPCEKQQSWSGRQCNDVSANHIQCVGVLLPLIYLKQSEGKHWDILPVTHGHAYIYTDAYTEDEYEFWVVIAFKAINVKRDYW